MNGADVWMVQRGSGTRFELESLQRVLIAGQLSGKKLQCNAPPKLQIFGSPYGSHASRSKPLEHSIMGNLPNGSTSFCVT